MWLKRGGFAMTPHISASGYNKRSGMKLCQIINTILELEMKVHEFILAVHRCASGEGVNEEDPHVTFYV